MRRLPPSVAILALMALLVLILALQALPASDAHPQGARAPPIVELSVNVVISQDTVQANVTNSQDGVAEFDGNVSVGKLPTSLQRPTVTLEVSPISGWELVISPDTMVFTNEMPQPFHLTVKVPAGTQAMSKAVTVTATAQDLVQTVTASTTATVAVRQYFKLAIGSMEPTLWDLKPGDTAVFEVTIYNEGNGKDTFSIDLVDVHHALDGFDLQRTVDIPAGQWVSISISADTREDFDTGNRPSVELRLIVTSTGAQRQGLTYTQEYGLMIFFETFMGNLAEKWPTYVMWSVGLVVVAVVLVVAVRRVRRRRRLDHDALASLGSGPSQ